MVERDQDHGLLHGLKTISFSHTTALPSHLKLQLKNSSSKVTEIGSVCFITTSGSVPNVEHVCHCLLVAGMDTVEDIQLAIAEAFDGAARMLGKATLTPTEVDFVPLIRLIFVIISSL